MINHRSKAVTRNHGLASGGSVHPAVGRVDGALAGLAGPSFWLWVLAAVVVAGCIPIFYRSIPWLIAKWQSPEYSHGMLIPLVSLFFVWRNRSELRSLPLQGAWTGVVLLAFALVVALAGTVGTIYLLVHIALVVSLAGFILAFFGWKTIKLIWFPLIYLFFMIPLPQFFIVKLSSEMQLLSSSLGVFFIRFLDISVFLEGNVIDLGTFKMQVVEACDGLRYLFPLMSFGFLIGYLYSGRFWQRAVIFLSTIPITIVMNSIRIAAIGAIFEYSGVNAATGFLHDFEGWAIFIVCIAILCLELQLFVMLNRRKRRQAGQAPAAIEGVEAHSGSKN